MSGLHSRLFEPSSNSTSVGKIIAWWEIRRIPYNLILGVVGLVSLIVYMYLCDSYLKPAENADDFVPMLSVIGFGLFANILYTSGWIVEVVCLKVRKRGSGSFGPRMLRIGLIFSLVVTALPNLAVIALVGFRKT